MEYKLDVERALAAQRQKSYQAHLRAQTVIPAGVMSRARLFSPFPFFVREGKGSKVIDIDGHEIIDCAMGYGPMILGHSHPEVVEAIREAAGRGSQFAIPHEEEYRLARLMVDNTPGLAKVSFCNSGSEAVYQAIRIARSVTGRPKIAKFEGGYHGGSNEVMANFKFNPEKGGQVESPNTVAASIGMPPQALADVVILPFNHEAAFEIIERHRDELAGVLVEVIQGMVGNVMGRPEFIRDLRAVTRRLEIPLLVDEIITGYRLGFGGGQQHYDIEADIATYGKIIGGGLAAGAVGGSEAMMTAIAYTGDPSIDTQAKPFYGGTFNGNLLTMAAGAVTLQHLLDHPNLYDDLDRRGTRLREGVNAFCRERELPVQMNGTGSMFCTHFSDRKIESARDLADTNAPAEAAFYPHLLKEGVFVPNIHMGFLSTAHSEEDIERVIQAHCNALSAVKKLGLM